MACSHWASVPEAVRRLFELCRRPRPTRYIANLSEWRPGQQPRPRLQTITPRTPAVAPKKKPWRSQVQFSTMAVTPSAEWHENAGYAQEFDSFVAVAVPCGVAL